MFNCSAYWMKFSADDILKSPEKSAFHFMQFEMSKPIFWGNLPREW